MLYSDWLMASRHVSGEGTRLVFYTNQNWRFFRKQHTVVAQMTTYAQHGTKARFSHMTTFPGQYPKTGEFKKKNWNSVCSVENNSMLMSFRKKLVYSIDDNKNVKTHWQCMSLMEKKLNFIFSISLFSGIALFQTPQARCEHCEGAEGKLKQESLNYKLVRKGTCPLDST